MPRARQLATGLFALAPLLGSGVMPFAQAAPATASVVSAPAMITSGGQIRSHLTTVTSTNWAGYVVTGGPFTSVVGTWTQPSVKCASGDQYSGMWVGLDGYSDSTVEQTGTEADCDGKTASYYAWYEMYPENLVVYSNPVKPGDSMSGSVTFSGTSTFTLTIKDLTQGWTKTSVKSLAGAPRSSAECIVEAPDSGGVLPLADFGTAQFTSCVVDGTSIVSQKPIVIDMVSGSGTLEAQTTATTGSGFSVKWVS
jgi:Peptidase A4 family